MEIAPFSRLQDWSVEVQESPSFGSTSGFNEVEIENKC